MQTLLQRSDKTPPISFALACGVIILLFLGMLYVVGVPLQLLTVSVSPWHLPVSFLLSLCIVSCLTDLRTLIRAGAFGICAVGVCILFCGLFYDHSWDGHWYHLEIVEALKNHWNTFLHPANDSVNQYSNHYPKAAEWIQSCFYATTDNINTTKCYLPLLLLACGFITWDASSAPLLKLTGFQRIVLSALAILNPVAWAQIFATLNDAYSYLYILLFLIATFNIHQGREVKLNYLILGISIIISVGTKSIAFFYLILTFLIVVAISIVYKFNRVNRQQFRRYIIVCIIVGIAATIFWGFHPYITNWYMEGNPLFPHTAASHEQLRYNRPEEISNMSRMGYFFCSINFHEVLPLYHCERVGGFGPLFAMIFYPVVAYNLLLCIFIRRVNPISFFVLAIILSCWIFIPAGWARFIVHLWIIVPFTFLLFCLKRSSRSKSWCSYIVGGYMLILAALNVAIIGVAEMRAAVNETIYEEVFFRQMKGRTLNVCRMNNHMAAQFSGRGIRYVNVDSIPPGRIVYFPRSVGCVSNEYFEVPPEDKKSVNSQADSIIHLSLPRRLHTLYELMQSRNIEGK